ncbi:MAG: hypothetical protein LBB21_03070, partial [Holosporaceae bacterium]|nr:hypothetical protein [Holosporaceae bacterium]
KIVDGYIKIDYKSGNSYEGEFKGGKKNGKGKLTYPDGSSYEGIFRDGKENGKGKFTYPDGSFYEGDFEKGVKKGLFLDKNIKSREEEEKKKREEEEKKRKIEEEKKNIAEKEVIDPKNWLTDEQQQNKLNILLNSNKPPEKITFFGKCDNNKIKKGKGVVVYPNGNYYAGNFDNNLRDGEGKFILRGKDNSIQREYNCLYRDGKIVNGYTEIYDIGGRISYEGEFKDGKKNGRGKFTYPDGSSYEGIFKDDEKDGEGIFTSTRSNTEHRCTYKDGKIVNGYIKIDYENGSSYEGEFKDGRKNGKGKLTYQDGSFYEGDFEKGVRKGKGLFVNKDMKFMLYGDWSNNGTTLDGTYRNLEDGVIKAGKLTFDGSTVSHTDDKVIEGKETITINTYKKIMEEVKKSKKNTEVDNNGTLKVFSFQKSGVFSSVLSGKQTISEQQTGIDNSSMSDKPQEIIPQNIVIPPNAVVPPNNSVPSSAVDASRGIDNKIKKILTKGPNEGSKLFTEKFPQKSNKSWEDQSKGNGDTSVNNGITPFG